LQRPAFIARACGEAILKLGQRADPQKWFRRVLRALAIACLVTTVHTSPAAAEEAVPPVLSLWDFERGITNLHGASYNVYQRDPSWARSFLDASVNPPGSTHSLRVTVQRAQEGFCGLWFDFHPSDSAPRQYVDGTPYRFLSFRVRGEGGGEDFELELVDAANAESEAEGPRVNLKKYLPGGATPEWRDVAVPLQDFPGIEVRRLARLLVHLTTPGEYRFHIDDIEFRRDRAGSPSRPDAPASKPVADAALSVPRAMWIWNPYPFFASEEETAKLFEFSKAQRIGEFYLSADLERRKSNGKLEFKLRQPESYSAFLRKARAEGFKVAALAGTPEWGARKYHAAALAAVDAIVRYNRAAPRDARFDSVHFDVEPYLLFGYSDDAYRPQILRDFVEMVAKCVERVEAEPGLTFSNDVPAWFYPLTAGDREALAVEFGGTRKPVGEHLIDLLGSVTLMDYVNRADGAGGIIARALPWLEYARARGRRIVVGVETFMEPGSAVFFALGLPLEGFRQRLAASGLRDEILFEGFRLALLSDGERYHVGLSAPRDTDDAKKQAYAKALVRLSELLGANIEPGTPTVQSILEQVRAAITRNPEWEGFEPYEVADPDSGLKVQGFKANYRMLASTTFHGLGRTVFEEETNSTAYWLIRYESFAGLAIHYYPSFRALVEGK
jgi:hypothetical protein